MGRAGGRREAGHGASRFWVMQGELSRLRGLFCAHLASWSLPTLFIDGVC